MDFGLVSFGPQKGISSSLYPPSAGNDWNPFLDSMDVLILTFTGNFQSWQFSGWDGRCDDVLG
jgi:hypothetical protein